MNIILLSGGSGKRLWPLSNEARSKQFLRLLSDENGNPESMVQRIFRQIRQSGIEGSITIATSESQIDSIRGQLGDAVEIVSEPERRDTFPAIALAVSYLYYEKHCTPNEPVVVMPVDPFTEGEYFNTIIKMETAVRENVADIVLMGIQPTYPSEKYGYIVPEREGAFPRRVRKFVEKPSFAYAESMIQNGAMWNGGVFAFKIGHIIDKLAEQALPQSFTGLREHYGDLRKISFDYEVVEKADSVAVVPFEGIWKDLGTWNTLSEQIHDDVGIVVRGEGTEDTQIINELDIPLVALGVKNMVIAASPDGILVSGKNESSYMKQYVDKISNRPMYEERRWGYYKVLDYNAYEDGTRSLTKHLFINEGKKLSYQSHHYRDEIWTIIEGTGVLLLDGHTRNVKRGDVAYITAGMKHALLAVEDLHMIEVQIGTDLAEADIVRYAMDW